MSMNKFMHPRNIYRKPPDYTELAIKYPEFRRKCKLNLDGTVNMNLKEAENLIVLTKALLEENFNLKVELPTDCLVPTVPLRLNYILWIEDIMSTMKIQNPIGIDIGCGASCIYSILIAKKNNWKMLALEMDEKNYEYARRNIEINDLHDKIEIFQQPNKNEIFKSYLSTKCDNSDGDKIFDFCLCNPPFFDINTIRDDNHEADDRNSKRTQPKNIRTGKVDELSCEGGEISFVKRIIDESLIYKHRIKVFTTMVGRKCDVIALLKIFKENNITNLIQAEFCQGNTTRWGLAWSFHSNLVLGLVPSLGFEKSDKQKKNFTCTLEITKNVENWKNELIQEITKYGLLSEILSTTEQPNQIKLLIKYYESKDKSHVLKKRKVDTNTKRDKRIKEAVAVANTENDEEVNKEVTVRTERMLDELPDLVFQIEVEFFNSKLNLKMTYLYGLLGVEGCYRWFCLLKNKVW